MELLNSLETSLRSALPATWSKLYQEALDAGNPHSKTMPLMNPFHAILVAIAYLLIIFLGRIVMKNRKRFDLKYFSLLHNGFLILLSAYMCFESLRQAILGNYTLWGNGVDPSAKGIPMARVLWLFYFSKPLEFIDTFIMVLKKNDRQISFLHIYHHVTIFIIWWIVVYYAPGGDGYFSACMNSFVHVMMYSYYFLASLELPAPWKNYVTLAQMFQFVLNIIQALYNMFLPSKYPKFLAYILFFYMITLLILFLNFFFKSKQDKRKKTS